ncbi:hypothetical protein [Acinetobacter baumannii]|uniref:hypothetical protein n=1 Tax=Acinetobacter baumannii TaxID=470 RepID=UPI002B238F99|nr:hypothetical protein [Acinetobacter baumannii]
MINIQELKLQEKRLIELHEKRRKLIDKIAEVQSSIDFQNDSVDVKKQKSDKISELLEELKKLRIDDVPAPGRPAIGVGRAVKITMPESDWAKIQEQIDNGHASSVADYFRQLHQAQWNPYVRQFGENWSLDGGHPFPLERSND